MGTVGGAQRADVASRRQAAWSVGSAQAEYIVQDLETPGLIITIEVSAPAQGYAV
jgi:hypothetical protein